MLSIRQRWEVASLRGEIVVECTGVEVFVDLAIAAFSTFGHHALSNVSEVRRYTEGDLPCLLSV